MKIRTGFVSNSSSSSFVIIGWKVDESDTVEIVEKIIGRKIKDEELDDGIRKFIYDLENRDKEFTLGFDLEMDYEDNECFIGASIISWSDYAEEDDIDLDKMLAEIKSKIAYLKLLHDFDTKPKMYAVTDPM